MSASGISRSNIENIYPLSPMQEGMLFHALYHPEAESYREQLAFCVSAPLDVDLLEAAFNALIARHAILRTAFVHDRGPKPLQIVLRNRPIEVDVIDQRELSPEDAQSQRRAYMAADRRRGYDFRARALMRVAVFQRARDEAWVVWGFHHIILDGWSLSLIQQELLELYADLATGRSPKTQLPPPYASYIRWVDTRDREAARAHWRRRLAKIPARTQMCASISASAEHDYEVRETLLHFDADTSAALHALARRCRATLNHVMQAIWAMLVAHESASDHVAFGAVVSGRPAEVESVDRMIGLFINTIPVCIKLDELGTLEELVARVHSEAREDEGHQYLPLAEILGQCELGEALFDHLVVFQNFPTTDSDARSRRPWQISDMEVVEESGHGLNVFVIVGEQLGIRFNYDARRVAPERIEELWCPALRTLAAQCVRDPGARVCDLIAELTRRELGAGTAVMPDTLEPCAAQITAHAQRLWFIDRFEAGTVYETAPTYHNIPVVVELAAVADGARLARAWQEVCATTLVTRLRFAAEVAELGPVLEFGPELEGGTAIHESAQMQAALHAFIERPFDLVTGPCVRALALVGPDARVCLAIVGHHIVYDHQGVVGLMARWRRAYERPGSSTNDDVAVRFAGWRRRLDPRVQAAALKHARRRLAGIKALRLPLDRPRPGIHTHSSGETSLALPDWSARAGLEGGLVAALHAGFALLMQRYSGQHSIVLGRSSRSFARGSCAAAVGHFENLQVLSLEVDESTKFAEFVLRCATALRDVERYGIVEFDRLVAALHPDKDMSRTALFDVLFDVVEGPGPHDSSLEGWGQRRLSSRGFGKYDLALTVDLAHRQLRLAYNRDFFDLDTVERLLARYRYAMDAGLARPDLALGQLPLESRQTALSEIRAANQTDADFERDANLWQLFARRARAQPHAIALVGPRGALEYGELYTRAQSLARELLARELQGQRVALLFEPGAAMVVAMLGVLAAGASYVPMDPEYPDERSREVLADADCRLLLAGRGTDTSFAADDSAILVVDFDGGVEGTTSSSAELAEIDAEAPAYVIYTSGSSGRPKGCIVSHRNVVRLLDNSEFPFDFSDSDVWVLAHSYCFDFSVWEIFGALTTGARLVLPTRSDVRDRERFVDLLVQQGVTVLNQTPAAFYALDEVDAARGGVSLEAHLRWVIFGGERLDLTRLKSWAARYGLDRVGLVNMYGITETTVHVTHKRIGARELREPGVGSPIGRPLPETRVYVLDDQQRPVPRGLVGELYVGGSGVALGYHRRPQLDAERFLADPFRPGARMYRTGDLGRYDSKGELLYLGRCDDQLQVRGFRIEPAEIEAALSSIEGIEGAMVVARSSQSGVESLVAYLCGASELDVAGVSSQLAARLPSHMVPNEWVCIDRFPLTANGKVDRAELASMGRGTAVRHARVAARTTLERELMVTWGELLELATDAFGVEDDFFRLGGHSLKATSFLARVRQRYGASLALRDFFSTPTIAASARAIATALEDAGTREVPVAPTAEDYPVTPGQHRIWLAEKLGSGGHVIVSATHFQCRLDSKHVHDVCRHLARGHEALRTDFREIGSRGLRQFIRSAIEVEVELEALDLSNAPEPLAAARRHVEAMSHASFDLATAPLWRVAYIDLGANQCVLAFALHHIISDGWSMTVLEGQFARAYTSRVATGELPAIEPPRQFKDFAHWRSELRDAEQARAHWRSRLADAELELPFAARSEAGRSDAGGHLETVVWSRDASQALAGWIQDTGTTRAQLMLAALTFLLHRLTGRTDICVGVGSARRDRSEFVATVGYFVQVLPVRCRVSGDMEFSDLLAGVGEALRDAMSFEGEFPDDMMGQPGGPRGAINVVLAHQDFSQPSEDSGLSDADGAFAGARKLDLALELGKFDLTLVVEGTSDQLELGFEFNPSKFRREEVRQYLGVLQKICLTVVQAAKGPA